MRELFFFIQHPEAFHQSGDLFRTWQGGNVFYGCILGGLTGSILYWFRRPFPVLADVRRGRAGGGDRNRGRADRLLPERLLPRRGLRPALGGPLPGRDPRLGSPGQRGPDLTAGDALSLPVHPRSSIRRRPGLLVLGLLLAYRSPPIATSGEVMALLMIALSADPLADRGDPERRAERLRRHDLVAEHQRAAALRRPGDVAARSTRPARSVD